MYKTLTFLVSGLVVATWGILAVPQAFQTGETGAGIHGTETNPANNELDLKKTNPTTTINRPPDNAPKSTGKVEQIRDSMNAEAKITHDTLDKYIADDKIRKNYKSDVSNKLDQIGDRISKLDAHADALKSTDLKADLQSMKNEKDQIGSMLGSVDKGNKEQFVKNKQKIDIAVNKLEQNIQAAEKRTGE